MVIEVQLQIPTVNFDGPAKFPDDQPVRELVQAVLSKLPEAPSLDNPAYKVHLERLVGDKAVALEMNRNLRDQGVRAGDRLRLLIEWTSAGTRERRLRNEFNSLFSQFAFSQFVTVTPARGNPPEEYLVVFRDVRGFEAMSSAGWPSERLDHQARIRLGPNYPNEPPECHMTTPIFHPNISRSGTICIGEKKHWSPGRTLVDIVVQIGKMIQWELLGLENTYTECNDAKEFAKRHERRLPIDNIDFRRGERGTNLAALHFWPLV